MAGRETVAEQNGVAEPVEARDSPVIVACENGTGPRASTDVVTHQSGSTVAHLNNLAHELHARGLAARVARARGGVAFVRVVNPLATTMQESVTCAPFPAGLHDWYYWWSWGECMHRVDDPAGAASKVAHVLDTTAAPAGP